MSTDSQEAIIYLLSDDLTVGYATEEGREYSLCTEEYYEDEEEYKGDNAVLLWPQLPE